MGARPGRDFASLLDDLFVARPDAVADEEAADEPQRPTIPFDYLSVAEELHSGRIQVSGEALAAEYREAGADLEAELEDLLQRVDVPPEIAQEAAPAEEPLPSVEPEAIAIELGLGADTPIDFGRLRRAFASKNHPDRVAPHMRDRAAIRMQIANALIDDARRRALAKVRR